MTYPKLISATEAKKGASPGIAYHEEREHEIIQLHEALAVQGK